MAEISLTTKQYLSVMRAIAYATEIEGHLADIREQKPDEELHDLWKTMMGHAEDFGLSFPEEKEEGEHWGDVAFHETHDDVHELLDSEFWTVLAEQLAEAEHIRDCTKPEHDDSCQTDAEARTEAWNMRLKDGDVSMLLPHQH